MTTGREEASAFILLLQVLLNYPVFDAGWMMAPRGFGTMLAMFLVARLINRVDNRIFILVGFLLTAASLWRMTGWSLQMGSGPILFAGFAQGFSLGCTFVPLNLLALSGMPTHLLTQATALRSLMRLLGGSIGIAILEAQLSRNTQIVHSRLVEGLRPDNPLTQAPFLRAPFDLTTSQGIAALNSEVTRQAAMIAYIDDFLLMLIVTRHLTAVASGPGSAPDVRCRRRVRQPKCPKVVPSNWQPSNARSAPS
jgi:MFS transporter, DHA2 family, multidrug resistance protein